MNDYLPDQNLTAQMLRISDKMLIRVPLCSADAKRSLKNILQWNAYLPTECVRTMVRLGWDYST